jgi:hypothetical protein
MATARKSNRIETPTARGLSMNSDLLGLATPVCRWPCR